MSSSDPVRAALDAVERRGDGYYIDDGTGVHVTASRSGGWSRPAVYVDAEDFMRVQKERNDLKRTLYLINGWRVETARPEAALALLLKEVGLTELDGKVCNSIVDGVLSGAFQREAE